MQAVQTPQGLAFADVSLGQYFPPALYTQYLISVVFLAPPRPRRALAEGSSQWDDGFTPFRGSSVSSCSPRSEAELNPMARGERDRTHRVASRRLPTVCLQLTHTK
jgi:hypothetical protein